MQLQTRRMAAARMRLCLPLLFTISAAPLFPAQPATNRIKDIATVAGRSGQALLGYGLVVGLEGTGDSDSELTTRALQNMLEQFDLKIDASELKADNVAAVFVTATLPAAAHTGDRIDVTVASVGDAESLYGALLLPTPLRGNDEQVYVIARGPVSIGGVSARGGGQKVQKVHPVCGRVVNGGTVIKTVPPEIDRNLLHLTLRHPDFTTALHISQAINDHIGQQVARAIAAESVEIMVPDQRHDDLVGFISDIEKLTVATDSPARVVINERTGTVIIGKNVRIEPVAIAHGTLTIKVKRMVKISQPPPFSGGTTVLKGTEHGGEKSGPPAESDNKPEDNAGGPDPQKQTDVPRLPGARTVAVPETELEVTEQDASLVEVQRQTRLSDLVEALNALGVKPRDLMAILQALKAANALQADLVLL